MTRVGCLLTSWLALSAVGCAGTTQSAGHVRVHEFLFGLSAGTVVDVRDVCPSGKAESIDVYRSFSAYALSIVTLGLYLPYDVRMRCSPLRTPVRPATRAVGVE